MKRFKFLLGINCQQPVGVPEQAIQKTFVQAYQPFLQAIANHPKLKFAGRFNGVLLEWLERKQPDHFELLRKLVKRGQLEMLAGGHYDPVLPLIPDDDKAGQISLANEYLKNNFGQAPRGLWLNGRTWEPSLPKILARSGIEYALVDEEHFLLAGIDPERITGYFLTEDEGELLKVFPTQGRFEEVYAGLKAVAGSEEGEAVVLVAKGEDPELSGQIDQLAALLEAPTAGVESWTFGNYLDEYPAQGRTYLPTTNELEAEGGYFRSQLVKYPEANYLHKKMILVSNKLRTAAQGKTGSMVKKGDVILRLSNPDLYLNILDSEAQLAEKENFLRNTQINMEQTRHNIKSQLVNLKYDVERKRRNFKQNELLIKDNLISREEYIRSQEDLEMAVKSEELLLERQIQDSIFFSININSMINNLDNMRRNLNMVRQRAENLNVRAPVDGQLGLLTPEIGQSISRGANMGQINVLTSYKVTAQIDEHYIDRVKTQLSATLDRQGNEFGLVVRRVYPEVRNGTFEIDMIFAETMPENIRTGQTYYISLQLGQPKVSVMVPIGGFFQETGGQWIFVLDPTESFATKQNISIGRKNPRYYEVLEGLQPGEKVIVSGYETFGKNEKLILRNNK